MTSAAPGSVAFRILTPGAANTYTSRVASATATAPGFDLRFPLPSSFPAGPVGVVEYRPLLPSGIPAGVPIAAGESIGIGQLKGSGETATIIASRPGGTIAFRADGQLPAGSGLYSTSPGRELALQATIEPDADHDGLGDETQDQCPARANDAGGRCVPVEVPGSERVVTVPGPERIVTVPAKTPAAPCAGTKGDARLRCLAKRACRTRKAGAARKACERRELARRRRAAKK